MKRRHRDTEEGRKKKRVREREETRTYMLPPNCAMNNESGVGERERERERKNESGVGWGTKKTD